MPVGLRLSDPVLVRVGTEPVPWKAVLAPGVLAGSAEGPVLLGLGPGAEGVDAPAVGEPRLSVLGAVSGTALPTAVVTASVPSVTEPGVVGLVPAVLVPRKQVTHTLGWRKGG